MPSFLKYGSTGRPPGKFHLRHSLKDFTYNLEFLHPPFDILFIEITNNNNNNNNNNINYIDNGGSGTDGTDGDTNDIAVPAAVGNNTNVVGHRSNQIAAASEWFANRFESDRCNYNYKYKFNIEGISTTTTTIAPATPATATINSKTCAEGISNEGHRLNRINTCFTDRIKPNRCIYKYKYKFNIDGISTTTTIAPATPATATINYKTSAEGISNESHISNRINTCFTDRIKPNRCNCNYKYKYKFNIDGISTTTTTLANYKTSTEGIPNENGEDAEAAAGLSEWFANLFELNRCNSISNNNNNNNSNTGSTNKDNYNKTFHQFFLFKLISLYLIITKSFSSKQFTKEPKEKQHHHHQQQHYHGKRRHQFHLEQQQKHQHFKQEQHNTERMVTSIVLKLSLVAWDMWTYRNGF
ncbi:MAG: hypothetical protein ACI8RD_000619 [Bacillariaceae sp.]|jgi:hypothetical protein